MGGLAELWRRPVRWLREHPLAADSLFAVVFAAVSLTIHLAADTGGSGAVTRDPTWWTWALVVITALTIIPRRVAPIATLFAATAAQMTCELWHVEGPGWLGVLIATYSLAAHTEGRRRTVAAAVAATAITLVMLTGTVWDDVPIAEAVSALALCVAAFVLGDNMRRRREHVRSLADRADRAEREQELIARERVAEERNRIARELHDIVAHSVSVMVLQAGAARRQMDRDQDAALGLLRNIEDTGRRTMDELRQVLGVLRNGDGEIDATPLPTLADLDDLVRAETELAVDLDVSGEIGAVPDSVALSTYRVVQEALTNSRRHAGPGVAVTVRVACAPGCVEVMVDDDGRGASANGAQAPTDGGGYGLLGMRERAGAAGGSLTAGPKSGGGWRVRARFPISS